MGKITKNTLFYGDNLEILRHYIDDESVDLIYLDPPFNSNRSYNVLFKNESGSDSEAQISAFDDTWHWGESAEETYYDLINNSPPKIANMIGALRQFVGTNQIMAYLVMMMTRLIELHRILKPTGCIYLHCDPTASHYLKVLMDTVFETVNFRNEIVWRRSHPKGHAFTRFANNHDVILAYSKDSNHVTWNPQYVPHNPEKADKQYTLIDGNGRRYQLTSLLNPNPDRPNLTYKFKGVLKVWRWTKERMMEEDSKGNIIVPRGGKGIPRYKRYLDEQKGIPVSDFWNDIEIASGYERLNYPTQKPEALLERIILASSNENDIVLDPFSGCGTAISVAQKLDRKWIGIDITQLAIALHKNRLKDMFGLEPKKDYEIIGEPESLHDAKQLAQDNRFQFEWWALSLIEARPAGGKKKSSDKGIDGIISFTDEAKGKVKQVLVQVKSGRVNSGLIRDFRGTIERENNAVMGIFISLENPTKDMEVEALEAGFYVSPFTNQKFRKIHICTIEAFLNDKFPDLPQTASFTTFKKAEKVKKLHDGEQGILDLKK